MAINASKSRRKLKKLRELMRGDRRLLIVMQDHPDPDSIAAATALKEIANDTQHINCTIAHGGIVGRAENRALIKYLAIKPRLMVEIELDAFDLVALVDTQPETGNNSLPDEIRPDIIIDHHPIRKASRGVPFTDIRSDYGATSTILCEYLREAELTPEPPLATALLYGIRTDTLELAREACKADTEAHFYLYPLSNPRMLAQIENAGLPSHYYNLLYKALYEAKRYGNCVFAGLGRVENPDMMGEVADLLVRMEGVEWCLCSGAFQGKILISLRRRPGAPIRTDAAKIAKKTVGDDGTSGGHQHIAGGQIPCSENTDEEIKHIEQNLCQRFLHALKQDEMPVMPLIFK